MEQIYDAIVVGGGPAGAAVATHLARAGREVLLLERAQTGRDKPCGEFFSPPVRGLLTELGVYEETLRAGVRDVPAARLVSADGTAFEGCYTNEQHPWAAQGGFSLERRVLDALLWQNAVRTGADARNGVTLRGLMRDASGTVVGVSTDAGEFRASVVIGADGGRSRVARDLGVVRPISRLQKIGLISHFERVSQTSDTRVEMHVGANGLACGFGPQPNNTANVTIEVPQDAAGSIAQEGAAAYCDRLLRDVFPTLAAKLSGARRTRIRSCGTFGHTTRTPIADGALLVGDAAEFIDPFTGEGVYFALRGAQMAAQTLETALRRGDVSVRGLRPYARARKHELSPKYAVCGLVERAVHSPGLMRVFAPKLGRAPHVVNALLGVTGDMANPYRLLSPRVLLGAVLA